MSQRTAIASGIPRSLFTLSQNLAFQSKQSDETSEIVMLCSPHSSALRRKVVKAFSAPLSEVKVKFMRCL